MGKPKNRAKGRDVDEDSDTEVVKHVEESESKPAAKQSKKDKRKKKKDDDWEDDIASELASLSVEANKGNKDDDDLEEAVVAPVKRKEKKKKKKVQESDDEEEVDEMPAGKHGNKMAAFNMLMMEEDDNSDTKSESEEEVEMKQEEKQEPSKQQKKKEKKKKGKEKTAEEEDLDALLAEIDKPKEKSGKKSKKDKKKEAQEKMDGEEDNPENELEAEPTSEVEKVEPKVVTMEDLEDDDDKKKRKKKEKKEEARGKEEEEGEDAEGQTVKTAAQKRKEKKERERLKKLADKKKQSQKSEGKPSDEKVEREKSEEGEEKPETQEAATDASKDKAASGDEGEEEGDGKKKKKKKKGEKEEKEKKKKKAPVAAIKELLKKQKEEEERLMREEEERIKREEEAIAAAIEAKRLADLKRQQKKEKEKERKARLKAEGKLLTAQQKQDKIRAQQMLESMKAQGIELPQKDEEKKKRPVYVDKKKQKKQKKDDATDQTPSPETTPAQTPVQEEAPQLDDIALVEPEVEEKKEEVKEEVKDEWDASSAEEEDEDEEKESSPEFAEIEVRDAKAAEEDEDDDDEEEEDDDNDEDDDDSDDDDGEDSEDDDDYEDSESEDEDLSAYDRAASKIKKRFDKCEAKRTTDVLRAPVVCVLGHVDTGKTKILDKLRRTNVQDGEAGGITQQIGATNVPHQAILDKTTMCKEFQKKELKLPGLLIIDTPGHESFSNLRSRGSSLCDIAILVIDIMHGLEPQTIESINLLKERKTPFIVALNKIDRLYQWKSNPNSDVVNTIKRQNQMAKSEFDERSRAVITQLAEQSLNAALFYENKNPKEYVSLVPTSAHTGDGMGNLVALICELTQTWLAKKVSYSEMLHATVMEVKALTGLGTTIDVILVNGKLREGDQIVIAGTEGPIVTQIRGLLMPQPLRELRVKAQYEHHKEVIAAQGVKIIGKDLEKAIAGLPLYVATDEDEVEYYKEELSAALKDVLNSIKISERGVFVQASTLGSLEALLEFLRTSKIPYAGINIGPVHKRDIMKASVMLEHDSQWAVILAFDVKVERDAQEMADSLGVRIFTADIIYHLQDKFLKYREDLKKQKQEEFKHIAVFPCKLRVLPQYIFNSRDPIVIGVMVEAGIVRIGTPICVPSKEFVFLGNITSIEVNHKCQETARKGQEVCIKIENVPGETPKLYGRHFDHEDMLVSRISRASIDAVKDHFREEMTKPDWGLMVELKKLFQIF